MSLLTLIAPACDALGLDPLADGLQLLDARHLAARRWWSDSADPPAASAWSEFQQVGPYRPDRVPFPLVTTQPALLCHVTSQQIAAVTLALHDRYPADHPVTLVLDGGARVTTLPLGQLERAEGLDERACLFVKPLAPLDDLRGAALDYIVMRLLGPAGCPWDREQTHRSLRQTFLEETYEVLEAIDSGDMAGLAEELGDVLLNVLMQAEMARQSGAFDRGDVYQGVSAKLIRRHPHVFGEVVAGDSATVLGNWHRIKQAERAASGKSARGTLDGIPPALPALMTAQELTRKAARAGFVAPDVEDSWTMLAEEIAELRAATRSDGALAEQRVAEECGDLLLAAATLAWYLGVDAESALRTAGDRFRRRFAELERITAADGRELATLSVAEKLALWERAKEDNG